MLKFKKVGCAPNKVILRKVDNGNGTYGKTQNGVIVKNESQNLKHEGVVLAVGKDLQSWIKVGDTVSHGMHAGIVYGSTSFITPGEEIEALLVLHDYEINEVVGEDNSDTTDKLKTSKEEE